MNDATLEIRRAPWWLFVLLLAASVLMTVLFNHWYLPGGLWIPVYQRSHGLVNRTLIWGLVSFLVVICGIVLGVGGRRPTEVGIEWRKLRAAGLYTCVLWMVVQAVLLSCYAGFGKSIDLANGWDSVEVMKKAGGLLGQLMGNALCEEILFRGFLMMQCVLLFRARWPDRPWMVFIASVSLASAMFALLHLPTQLRADNYASLSKLAWDQVQVFMAGCVFGWIYWQTRNLFFVVSVHALSNVPVTLLAWHDLGPLTRTDPVVLLVGIGIAAAWDRLPATHEPLPPPHFSIHGS